MKSKVVYVVATMLVVPGLAFAAQKNSANVNLDQPVKVAGTQLATGQYKLIWEGSGPEVTVSFLGGKKTVATASARLVKKQSDQVAIETATGADNTSVLRAVDLKNLTIQFENPASGAGN